MNQTRRRFTIGGADPSRITEDPTLSPRDELIDRFSVGRSTRLIAEGEVE